MRLIEQQLPGVQLIEAERHCDGRGYFQRTFDAAVIGMPVAQGSIALNTFKGTVRGLHWQVAPHAEQKLITCLQGGIFDVLVDLREGSATYGKHMTVELWDSDGTMLWVPEGIAHGYQTLTANTLVGYQMSVPFSEPHARRVRWNDPSFGVRWPLPVSIISDADRDAA